MSDAGSRAAWPGLCACSMAMSRLPGQLRSGTVGHNAFRTDFSVSFGGFKQSGIGREGIHEGLPHFLETKFVILEGRPAGYENTEA
jgi:acyl-CoA reductase-like NAD-dependent aldehyde dehydrogenase